jgi:hypothetical protein
MPDPVAFNLVWDAEGQRTYETGVDRGVLYVADSSNANNTGYASGVAWNGLSSVSENPSGAEATAIYADNIKYLNLISAEEFGATIEAYTYPDEFAQCDGSATPATGVYVGQQPRKKFGFCYRTRFGNDVDGTEYGYKLHLVYNATAAPSEKSYETINDSPEAITFSWELTTVPATFSSHPSLKPTACIVIDSTKVDATKLASLEALLYGTAASGNDPAVAAVLPTPDTVISLFE